MLAYFSLVQLRMAEMRLFDAGKCQPAVFDEPLLLGLSITCVQADGTKRRSLMSSAFIGRATAPN